MFDIIASAAANLEAAIRCAYDTLAENPNAFPPCDDPRLRGKGYRKCVLTNYLFVYEVLEQENLVKIHRFFHGLQNWSSYL